MRIQRSACDGSSEAEAPQPRDDVQFGIRYLLGWTAVSALLLSMGRVLAPEGGWLSAQGDIVESAGRISAFGALLLVLLVPPLALCGLTLSSRSVSFALVAGAVVAWASLTWAAAYVLHLVITTSDSLGDLFYVFTLMQLGATAASCLTAAPLRLRGFRLHCAKRP